MMKLQERIKSRGEDGLSLIEMVVAIVVFAIVALSAYPLFIKSVEVVSLNNISTAASITVNDILEEVRQNPNCLTLNRLSTSTNSSSGNNIFKDGRGIEYRVVLAIPGADGCVQGTNTAFEITATRVSDSKVLLEQSVQVLIPPRNGLIELD